MEYEHGHIKHHGITNTHWHKSRPHSAYNSDHTQQYSLQNSWCGSASLSHTTPLHLSLSLSLSRSHHPIYLPPPCLNILYLSSLTPLHRDASLWIRQLYLNTTAPIEASKHTPLQGCTGTEGCFIARRAVTHAWLPISLFIIWCEKLITIFLTNVQSTASACLRRGLTCTQETIQSSICCCINTRIHAHVNVTWSRRRLAASGKGETSGRASV